MLGVRSPFVRAEEEVVRCAEAFSEGGGVQALDYSTYITKGKSRQFFRVSRYCGNIRGPVFPN